MATRYHLGTVAPATADAAGVMAALASLFAVAADVDTAAAVSGVLTWTRDSATATSQAIYSNAFGPRNTRIIIAVHDSGSPPSGPTMVASADTFTAANILIGLCDNAAGAYVNWYAAAPFSGCTFAGYYRLCAVSGLTSLRAMLSAYDLKLQTAASTTVATCHAGAVLKGVSGYQESDGFRYGLMVSGVTDMASNWRSMSTSGPGYYAKNAAVNGQGHAGIYAVGGSTWQTITMADINPSAETLDSWKWDATTAARAGIAFMRSSAPLNTVGTWLGVTKSATGLTGQNVTGTSDSAVRFSASIITSNEESCLVWRTFS